MEKFISNLTRLFKHGQQIKNLHSQINTKDNPEITSFLKNN